MFPLSPFSIEILVLDVEICRHSFSTLPFRIKKDCDTFRSGNGKCHIHTLRQGGREV